MSPRQDLFPGTTLYLHANDPDVTTRLAQWVRVPGSPGARLEGDGPAAHARGRAALEARVRRAPKLACAALTPIAGEGFAAGDREAEAIAVLFISIAATMLLGLALLSIGLMRSANTKVG